MAESLKKSSEPILVLCHTFFHDAFRGYPIFTIGKFEEWKSAQFVIKFIIEKQSELPEGKYFSVTSKKAFANFLATYNLITDKPNELVKILENLVFLTPDKSVNNLEINESVIAICDILYNLSKYNPVLITNMPSKKELTIKFYQDSLGIENFKEKDIPFQIENTASAEQFLRENYPDICKIVDERSK